MASIKRDYVPIPGSDYRRFWVIDTAFISIGVGCYETMVFEAVYVSDGNYDTDWDEFDVIRTYNVDAAMNAHLQMIKKWSNITREEALKRYDERSKV